MNLPSLFLGAYIVGAIFTYFSSHESFAFDDVSEAAKIALSLAYAVLWPVSAICLIFMTIKETIFD